MLFTLFHHAKIRYICESNALLLKKTLKKLTGKNRLVSFLSFKCQQKVLLAISDSRVCGVACSRAAVAPAFIVIIELRWRCWLVEAEYRNHLTEQHEDNERDDNLEYLPDEYAYHEEGTNCPQNDEEAVEYAHYQPADCFICMNIVKSEKSRMPPPAMAAMYMTMVPTVLPAQP